jgi:uncharacterized protein
MKSRAWISIFSVAATLASFGEVRAQQTVACGDQRQPMTCRQVVVSTPVDSLTVAVADNYPLREHGLMFRTSLEPRTGMLFVFPVEGVYEFWMKNTLIPLDMVFVDRRGIVTSVASNVPATTPSTPEENIPRRSGRAKFVFELPAGEASSDGLKPGAVVRIPPVSAKE